MKQYVILGRNEKRIYKNNVSIYKYQKYIREIVMSIKNGKIKIENSNKIKLNPCISAVF